MFRLVLVLAALSSATAAQDTGGSFGGGDFGGGDYGGGDYGGGDYGGGDYGSSGDSSWSGDFSGGSSGGDDDKGFLVFLATTGFVGLLLGFIEARKRWPAFFGGQKKKRRGRQHATPQLVDVSAISLAIDWRARAALQARLAELARSGDTRSKGGLRTLLHETVAELRRLEYAWLYAGALNASPARPDLAEQTFRSAAQEMRSRFKRELVRSHDGAVRTDDAGALRAKREEGQGVVVVTVVVAARGEIPDVAHAADAEHIRMLIRALGGIGARRLVALEVIWSPAAEDDRMSTAELEALYPELRRIDHRSIVGRVFCGYCAFPYPAELRECPHCGAPANPGEEPL